MSAGKIMQVGTPQEIYHDPANLFVATFLGSPSINLLERDGRLVGFRPEHFLPMSQSDVRQDLVAFPFEVVIVENIGADSMVYGNISDMHGYKLIASKIPSIVSAPVEAGRTYDFVVERSRLRFFDKKTELRTDPVPV
jgi:multiple sugar transport system ATP-binding protein